MNPTDLIKRWAHRQITRLQREGLLPAEPDPLTLVAIARSARTADTREARTP